MSLKRNKVPSPKKRAAYEILSALLPIKEKIENNCLQNNNKLIYRCQIQSFKSFDNINLIYHLID